jgi:hypothetical protein
VIRPAVVIPVHKPRLTDAETASLRQVQAGRLRHNRQSATMSEPDMKG